MHLIRRLVIVVAAVSALTATSCGGKDDPALPTLSVATVNIANAADIGGVSWQTRIDRLADAIASAQLVPDIISMTESAGLWNANTPPFVRAGDYDMADRLIYDLKGRLGADYRIAYMTGVSGNVNNDAGTPLAWFYTGDTLLYNPDRLANLTPADVDGRPQVAHDGPPTGFQVRRSLPICARGTNLMPLEQLIDGPDQTDRCPVSTPAGPVWAQVEVNSGGAPVLVATLARFAFRGVSGSSFDVVTVHPQDGEEDAQAQPINDFIAGLTSQPYRTSAPYYPVLVVGDFNSLADPMRDWPAGTTQVFRPTVDVMGVSRGSGVGMQPAHQLSAAFTSTLPTPEPCALPGAPSGPVPNQPAGAFSDHCGLVVRFDGA